MTNQPSWSVTLRGSLAARAAAQCTPRASPVPYFRKSRRRSPATRAAAPAAAAAMSPVVGADSSPVCGRTDAVGSAFAVSYLAGLIGSAFCVEVGASSAGAASVPPNVFSMCRLRSRAERAVVHGGVDVASEVDACVGEVVLFATLQ